MVNGAYKLNDQIVLNASVPFVDGRRKELGLPDRTISGLGDLTLSAIWRPFSKEESYLKGFSFSGGLVLPTGDPAQQPLTGVASPSVFQLGTGAYQLTAGATYTWGARDWNYRVTFNVTFPLDESSDGFKPAVVYYGSFSAGRSYNDDVSYRFGIVSEQNVSPRLMKELLSARIQIRKL